MFSSRSCSPLVMNRLTPSMCHEPSGWRSARVRPAPTSEPASGSVRTIVEAQCLSAQVLAQPFCSSVPRPQSTWANAAPVE